MEKKLHRWWSCGSWSMMPGRDDGCVAAIRKREWDGMDCQAERAIREVKDFQKDPLDVWQHVCKSPPM